MQALDPLLENYLERSLDVLLTVGAEAIEELTVTSEGETNARIRFAIKFPRSSHLNVRLIVLASDGIPSLKEYSFHFQTHDGATVFRYDNSEHYPGLPNSPHHKHEGPEEVVIGCPQPSIRAIRDEIAAYLDAGR